MNKGAVIFLNGTSSSGKTSISNELVNIMDEDYIRLSVDDILEGINKLYLNMYPKHLDDTSILEIEQKKYIESPIISLFHHSILAFSSIGKNLIVDHVLVNPVWLDECVRLLSDHPVLFVGVHCPIEELERRELERGNRRIGLARSQLHLVHRHEKYDIEVNTYESGILECANGIKNYLNNGEQRAFTLLACRK